MEDRERNRREVKQARTGLRRAPRYCALGKTALHTHPEGWAASHARGTHSAHLCQGPQPPLMLHLLPLLSLRIS